MDEGKGRNGGATAAFGPRARKVKLKIRVPKRRAKRKVR